VPSRRQSRLTAGDADEAPPAVLYARYLESLASRPNHGDHAFPRGAAAALVLGVADRREALAAGAEPPQSGAWFAARALEMALLATSAAPFDRRLRQDMAWAAVVLPVGVFLGPALLRVLGGAVLWQDSSAALRAAAFGGRLDGVPARSLGLLARLGGEGVARDATSRRLLRPTVALAQAALAADLGRQVAPTALAPEHAVARALALRYGERMRGLAGSPGRPA
jgi:hypothetical protein